MHKSYTALNSFIDDISEKFEPKLYLQQCIQYIDSGLKKRRIKHMW